MFPFLLCGAYKKAHLKMTRFHFQRVQLLCLQLELPAYSWAFLLTVTFASLFAYSLSPVLPFLGFKAIPWLILSNKGFPWLFVRFPWLFFQGFSGFGRGHKSLVSLRFFLGKTEESKERKDRKLLYLQFELFAHNWASLLAVGKCV